MPTPDMTPFYYDWEFWAVVVAFVAVVLSQLPPIHVLLRSRRLNVEVHSRMHVTHKVGNPNVSLYVGLNNTGGRALRIQTLHLKIFRDGVELLKLPAQNFFEKPSEQTPVLFVPFSLGTGEQWGHIVHFLNFFDRQTDKDFRKAESALRADIRDKLNARPEGQKESVKAEPEIIAPFIQIFERFFIWSPGEYVVEVVVLTEPGSTTYSKQYRFTLYESDTAELESYKDDYFYGAGIAYDPKQHVGISVPIVEHKG